MGSDPQDAAQRSHDVLRLSVSRAAQDDIRTDVRRETHRRNDAVGMNIARLVDHTNIRPDAARVDIERLCDEAAEYGLWSVAIMGAWIPLVRRRLEGSGVRIVTGPGAMYGGTTEEKVFGARRVIQLGADEVDMVINVGALKSGELALVRDEIAAVVEACKETRPGTIVKAILECCYLRDDEKVVAAKLAEEAGVDFVKTSTGLGPSGATAADVRLLRSAVSAKVKVKAAGGIKTQEQAMAMIEAGAERIGSSCGVQIVRGY
jgi:deoxyribose-phosphate aldolase